MDGHVLEVTPPDPEAVDQSKTYNLNGEVQILYFRFQSVKSKLRVCDRVINQTIQTTLWL